MSVRWLDQAQRVAETWPDTTLAAVAGLFPYAPERNVRPMDWVELVAHVSATKGEDPVSCAERLALYATTYAERYGVPTPKPDTIRSTQ